MSERKDKTTPRRRVVDGIARMIACGEYAGGQRLPSEQLLAERFSVSRGTLRSGLEELIERGLVERRHGFGCYVCAAAGRPVGTDGASDAEDGRARTICFMVPLEETHSLFHEILAGVEAVAAEAGFELIFVNLSRHRPVLQSIAQFLRRLPDGVVFSPLMVEDYYEANSRFIDVFEERKLNYVVVDSPVANSGIIRGNFVGADGYGATREIVHALAAAGHRKIGSIRVFPGVYTSDQRFNGLVDQLRAEGLVFDPARHLTIEQCDIHEQGRPMARALMKLADPPTAIVCSHDTLAINTIDELRKLGFRVPEDVSVFGFDDDNFAAMANLATVRQPFRRIGERAARMLIETSSGSVSGPRRQEFLPCELVIRASVGKCGGVGN